MSGSNGHVVTLPPEFDQKSVLNFTNVVHLNFTYSKPRIGRASLTGTSWHDEYGKPEQRPPEFDQESALQHDLYQQLSKMHMIAL